MLGLLVIRAAAEDHFLYRLLCPVILMINDESDFFKRFLLSEQLAKT